MCVKLVDLTELNKNYPPRRRLQLHCRIKKLIIIVWPENISLPGITPSFRINKVNPAAPVPPAEVIL